MWLKQSVAKSKIEKRRISGIKVMLNQSVYEERGRGKVETMVDETIVHGSGVAVNPILLCQPPLCMITGAGAQGTK